MCPRVCGERLRAIFENEEERAVDKRPAPANHQPKIIKKVPFIIITPRTFSAQNRRALTEWDALPSLVLVFCIIKMST